MGKFDSITAHIACLDFQMAHRVPIAPFNPTVSNPECSLLHLCIAAGQGGSAGSMAGRYIRIASGQSSRAMQVNEVNVLGSYGELVG